MTQPFPAQKAAEAVNQIFRTLSASFERLGADDPLRKEVERSMFSLGLLSAGIWGLLGKVEGNEAISTFLAAIETGDDPVHLFDSANGGRS